MSLTGIEAFDSTIHKTNAWLNDLNSLLNWEERRKVYAALRAVLHALRDRLTVEEAVQLGDQMPMLVRGFYYEGWRPGARRPKEHKLADFLTRVLENLGSEPESEVEEIVLAVFNVLDKHISEGEIENVKAILPKELRNLWMEEELLLRC